MRKKSFQLLAIVSIASCVMISSCSGGSTKVNPEDEVRNYGKRFVENLNAKQLDSLKVTYPDIVKADSLVTVQSDTILVAPGAPGQYDMTLANGVTLKVNRADDGTITVTESKGLFAFPDAKIDVAQKTGMWDENLNDAQRLERMKDEGFFSYLQANIKKKTSKILTVGNPSFGSELYIAYFPIKNNTDQEIKGDEYVIMIEESYPFWNDESGGYDFENCNITRSTAKGKTIPPHGTYKYEAERTHGGIAGEAVTGVKLKLTPEQIQERFASYTGNEYQEYLDSKK